LSYGEGISLRSKCYHEKLSIVGNSRMCLVEINQGMGLACALNWIKEKVTKKEKIRD